MHHVGSTAVPELAAKSEIDILAVIDHTGTVEDWIQRFETLGYRRGGDLSSGHHFFKRDINGFALTSSTVAVQAMSKSPEC